MQKKIIFFISVNPFKNIHNSCILNRVGGAVALKEQEGLVFVHGIGKRKSPLQKSIEKLEEYLDFKYEKIVADAGYESEENYLFMEQNGQISFIKPSNYEISKSRKYKNDISRVENMTT